MNRDIAIKQLAEILEARAERQRKNAEQRLRGVATVALVERDFHAEAAEAYDAALAQLVLNRITDGDTFGGDGFITPAEHRLYEAAKRAADAEATKSTDNGVQAPTGREWAASYVTTNLAQGYTIDQMLDMGHTKESLLNANCIAPKGPGAPPAIPGVSAPWPDRG